MASFLIANTRSRSGIRFLCGEPGMGGARSFNGMTSWTIGRRRVEFKGSEDGGGAINTGVSTGPTQWDCFT